jgi:KIF-1 binding protein C terminal
MNDCGLKSIQWSKEIAQIILKMEGKFDYAQAILNQYLSTARIYSKLFDKDDKVVLKNLELSFRDYEFLGRFVKDFMKEKQLSNPNELPPGMQEPYHMMREMIELLPLKISKLNAKIANK